MTKSTIHELSITPMSQENKKTPQKARKKFTHGVKQYNILLKPHLLNRIYASLNFYIGKTTCLDGHTTLRIRLH